MAGTKIKKLMTIDPGLSGTGYSVWHNDTLILCRQIIPENNLTMEDKAKVIKKMLIEAINYRRIDHVAIEYPKVFGGATNMAIAMRGDIVKLAWFVGYICGAIVTNRCVTYELVPVNTWKGQLPKSVIENRVRKIFPDPENKLSIKGHAIDAVGIGLFLKGKM